MQLPPGARVRVLDLRAAFAPEIARAAVASLGERDVLEVVAGTEPTAWVAELRGLGFGVSASLHEGSWFVRAGRGALPELEDLTNLEAPEPMHRVLQALAGLAPGAVYLARLPHRPAPLLPLLDARGARYDVALRPDGSALLWLSR